MPGSPPCRPGMLLICAICAMSSCAIMGFWLIADIASGESPYSPGMPGRPPRGAPWAEGGGLLAPLTAASACAICACIALGTPPALMPTDAATLAAFFAAASWLTAAHISA
eukprot:5569362-Pyramimonas_sp.AAC.1